MANKTSRAKERIAAIAWSIWALRVVLVGVVVLLLSYVPYRIVSRPTERKLLDMNNELARVTSEIVDREVLVDERRRRVRALKTDTRAIESIARDNLQMLYPHEKTLRLSPKKSSRSGAGADGSNPQ